MAEFASEKTSFEIPKLMITAECLPVPFPNEEVQKVRDWLKRVLPLASCEQFSRSITQVRYDCGPDAPTWVRKIAKETAAARPSAFEVQVACYSAMVEHPLHEAYGRIFNTTFASHGGIQVNAPLKLQKLMSTFYYRRFEFCAVESSEFRANPAEGRAAIYRVEFDVSCEPLLFPDVLE